jgi:3-methyladenine DNA glycosylase AlkD
MIMMAEAWLLATIAISYQDEIYDYLSKCQDQTLKRKTISKICDSFRFNEYAKNRFKSLR